MRSTYFNPRSLAGATSPFGTQKTLRNISIHAPSRERPSTCFVTVPITVFQSTLPRGSDLHQNRYCQKSIQFQSTLPRGSDNKRLAARPTVFQDFNPRSLAGATTATGINFIISLFQSTLPRGSDSATEEKSYSRFLDFNPRSLAGATCSSRQQLSGILRDFNPRSLAGATTKHLNKINDLLFQSTLPRGSDSSS